MKGLIKSRNRFVISKIKVNAPISFKKVGRSGKMPMPNSPDDIAYYDFSLFPGLGGQVGKPGNAIFSGHVDSGFDYCDFGKTPPPCAAVLWNADKLSPDDKITIKFEGKRLIYRIKWNREIIPKNKTWEKTILKTAREAITIITCAGEFIPSLHQYKNRRIIRAIRS